MLIVLTLTPIGPAVNLVRMAKQERYHHGDLRAALLAAARKALDEDGHEKLSLLKLTASLGVSPAAPYRHFASREALLLALVEEGLAELEAKAEAAAATPGHAQDRLRAACAAYLDFAEQEPGLFRLLMGSAEGQAYVTQITGGATRAYQIFEELVREMVSPDGLASARSAAAMVWSQLHGYAVLKAGGLFKRVLNSDLSREATIEAAVRLPAIVSAMHRSGQESAAGPART